MRNLLLSCVLVFGLVFSPVASDAITLSECREKPEKDTVAWVVLSALSAVGFTALGIYAVANPEEVVPESRSIGSARISDNDTEGRVLGVLGILTGLGLGAGGVWMHIDGKNYNKTCSELLAVPEKPRFEVVPVAGRSAGASLVFRW